jgi:hypothetical protein
MNIEIISSEVEVTAFKKRVSFKHEGEIYHASLYWDEHDGYDLIFKNKNNSTPEWALDYPGADSLEYIIDSLTVEEVSA